MNKMAVLVPVWFVAASFASSTWGQEKRPLTISGEGVKGRYVQQHVIDMDDAPGHQLRVYEAHRDYPADKAPVVDGERIVEAWVRGFSSYTGVGPVWGNTTFITDKGNKIFVEGIGTSESKTTDTGSKRGTYHGTSRFVGGTGRFAKIRGTFVDVSQFDTGPKTGYNTVDTHGEYWFEQ